MALYNVDYKKYQPQLIYQNVVCLLAINFHICHVQSVTVTFSMNRRKIQFLFIFFSFGFLKDGKYAENVV